MNQSPILEKYYMTDLELVGIAEFGTPIFVVLLSVTGLLTSIMLMFPNRKLEMSV